MKLLFVQLFLFIFSLSYCQIDSIKALNHTVHYLSNNFTNQKSHDHSCSQCYECNEIPRQDTIEINDTLDYVQNRLVGSCIAYNKLQKIRQLDTLILEVINSDKRLLYEQIEWINQVELSLSQHMDDSMMSRGGLLIEQLDYILTKFEKRYTQLSK